MMIDATFYAGGTPMGYILDQVGPTFYDRCDYVRTCSHCHLVLGRQSPPRHCSAKQCPFPIQNQSSGRPNPLFLEHGFRVDEVELYGEDDNYAFYVMYRGCLDDCPIIVKKFIGLVGEDELRSLAIRDMVITTQMSKHKNVLKLLSYCLEFPIRLQVAKELANALTYLHTALSRPIIHRDIRPNSVFMDHDFVPKFSNFSLTITIPPDQSPAIDTVKGDLWYLDPTYRYSRSVTQKSDIYSFGVLLLVLLAGERPMYDTLKNMRDILF
ncbi:non-functional pseudokinase ZRK2-like [Castanea sativa]|uniref:non-functional pseudokinase ZRK2-like n=1 Tax=Castanea sativa TaxID=21020 RepID=UPI003F653C98